MFRVEGSFPPPSFLLPPLSLPDIVSFLTDLYLEQILTGEIPISPFREFILYGRPSAVTPSSHQPFQSRNTYGLKDLKQQRERVGGGLRENIKTITLKAYIWKPKETKIPLKELFVQEIFGGERLTRIGVFR